MIKPVLQDATWLRDVRDARLQPDQLHLWWLGQSGFLIQWQGRHLLFDPYLSDSLTRKYASTDKPHVRLTERVVDPAQLGFVDVVTSSHNHTDHLDAETLNPMRAANPRLELVVPEANRGFVAERLACDASSLRGLDAGQSVSLAGFTLHGIPAAHNELDRDAHGHHRYLGYILEAGPWRIYHSGDTLQYDGMENWLRSKGALDVALLPINGNKPERRVAGNLDGREAAALACAVGVRRVIPCHYEMFAFNTASPDEFVAECQRLGQPHQVLRAGERWTAINAGSAAAR